MAASSEDAAGSASSMPVNVFLICEKATADNKIETVKQEWVDELRGTLANVARVILIGRHQRPAQVLANDEDCGGERLATYLNDKVQSDEVTSGDIVILAIGLDGLTCAQALSTYISDSPRYAEVRTRLCRLAFIDTPFREGNDLRPVHVRRYLPPARDDDLLKLCGHYRLVQEGFSDFLGSCSEDLDIRYYCRRREVQTLTQGVEPIRLSKDANMEDMKNWILGLGQKDASDAQIKSGISNHATVGDTNYNSSITDNAGIVSGGVASTATNGVNQRNNTTTHRYDSYPAPEQTGRNSRPAHQRPGPAEEGRSRDPRTADRDRRRGL